MDELKQGALLFSLGACLERERERFALLRAEADLQRAIEHGARVESEKSRLQEELSKERTVALARTEERRRLEEEARKLVRQRLAEMERSTHEAKVRAELEIIALNKAHERRLIEIQLATARMRNRMTAALVVLLFAAGIATTALFYFGRWRPETQRADVLFHELRAERARAAAAERLYADTRQSNARLAREVERLELVNSSRSTAPPPH